MVRVRAKLPRMPPARVDPSRYTYAAWVISGAGLLLVLQLRLLPAMLAGMLVYELVHLLAPTVSSWLSDKRAKLIAVVLLSALVVGAISAGIAGAIVFFKSDAGSISTLLTKMAEIVAGSRKTLPSWLVDQMPENPDDMGWHPETRRLNRPSGKCSTDRSEPGSEKIRRQFCFAVPSLEGWSRHRCRQPCKSLPTSGFTLTARRVKFARLTGVSHIALAPTRVRHNPRGLIITLSGELRRPGRFNDSGSASTNWRPRDAALPPRDAGASTQGRCPT